MPASNIYPLQWTEKNRVGNVIPSRHKCYGLLFQRFIKVFVKNCISGVISDKRLSVLTPRPCLVLCLFQDGFVCQKGLQIASHINISKPCSFLKRLFIVVGPETRVVLGGDSVGIGGYINANYIRVSNIYCSLSL